MLKRVVILAACVLAAPAVAQVRGTCPVPAQTAGRVDYRSLGDLPRGVVALLPGMADVGQPYQATDMIMPGIPELGRQMQSAWSVEDTFVIDYRYGGVAAGRSLAVIARRGDGYVITCDPHWGFPAGDAPRPRSGRTIERR